MNVRQLGIAFLMFVSNIGFCISINPESIHQFKKKLYQNRKIDFYLLEYNGYSDLRLDTNHDGKIDYWQIQKGPLKVVEKFKNGQLSELNIENSKNGKIQELTYQLRKNKMVLARVQNRAGHTYNQESQICTGDHSASASDQLLKFTAIEDAVAVENIKKIIDPSCKTILPAEEYEIFEKSILNANKYDSEEFKDLSSVTKNRNLACLEDPNPGVKNLEALKVRAAQYANLVFKNANGEADFKIKCTKDSANKNPAKFNEIPKEIIFNIKQKNGVSNAASEYRETYLHETLHMLGSNSEEEVHDLLGACFDAIKRDYAETSIKKKTDDHTYIGVTAVQSENADKILDIPASIPASIAEAPAAVQPSPQALAQVESVFKDPPPNQVAATKNNYSDAELTQALSTSSHSTSSVLSFASNATNAVAAMIIPQAHAEPSTSLASSGGSASSTLSSARNSNVARSPSSSVSAKVAQSSSGDVVTEQIEVTDHEKIQATAAIRSSSEVVSDGAMQKAKTSVLANNKSSIQKTVNANSPSRQIASTELSNSGGSPGFDSGSGAALSPPTSSASASQQKSDLGARSVTNAKSNQASNSNIVNVIVNSDYRELRKKISDQNFQLQLQKASIRLITINGDTIGDKKGQYIFRDNGTRFIRER